MAKDREDLERKLGQLTFKRGQKDEIVRKLITEIKNIEAESNDVATEIEKLG